jgi:hypothetical protein
MVVGSPRPAIPTGDFDSARLVSIVKNRKDVGHFNQEWKR